MSLLIPPKAPNLPIAPTVYNPIFADRFNNVLRLYFNSADNAMGALLDTTGGDYLRSSYGSFYDTTTQTAAIINTAYPVTFNTVDLQNGVTRGTVTSQISLPSSGVYNIQFSAQVHKTAGAVGNVYIWLRVNNANIANTAGKIAISGPTAESVPAWNYLYEFTAGDYFELVWSADDIRCQLLALAASAPVPAIPSVILTVTRVSGPI